MRFHGVGILCARKQGKWSGHDYMGKEGEATMGRGRNEWLQTRSRIGEVDKKDDHLEKDRIYEQFMECTENCN